MRGVERWRNLEGALGLLLVELDVLANDRLEVLHPLTRNRGGGLLRGLAAK